MDRLTHWDEVWCLQHKNQKLDWLLEKLQITRFVRGMRACMLAWWWMYLIAISALHGSLCHSVSVLDWWSGGKISAHKIWLQISFQTEIAVYVWLVKKDKARISNQSTPIVVCWLELHLYSDCYFCPLIDCDSRPELWKFISFVQAGNRFAHYFNKTMQAKTLKAGCIMWGFLVVEIIVSFGLERE